MTSNAELLRRSLRAVWHPCTQMKHHERLPLVPVSRARSVWLYDFEGHRYLDAVSSWWVNLFGHGEARIAEAIGRQAAADRQWLRPTIFRRRFCAFPSRSKIAGLRHPPPRLRPSASLWVQVRAARRFRRYEGRDGRGRSGEGKPL